MKGILKFESFVPTFEDIFLTQHTLQEHSILLFVINEEILIFFSSQKDLSITHFFWYLKAESLSMKSNAEHPPLHLLILQLSCEHPRVNTRDSEFCKPNSYSAHHCGPTFKLKEFFTSLFYTELLTRLWLQQRTRLSASQISRCNGHGGGKRQSTSQPISKQAHAKPW